MSEFNVGSVVLWSSVPHGALVRAPCGCFAIRIGQRGAWVLTAEGLPRTKWERGRMEWPWLPVPERCESVTIVALNLTGDESHEHLCRLVKHPDSTRGLYNKYIVTRSDGRNDPHAEYFVLRLDKRSRASLAALAAYADAVSAEFPALADDLRQRYLACRVGDVLAWDAVPDGALVREATGALVARIGDDYRNVLYRPDDWGYDGGGSWACAASHEPVTVVALGLTGDEAADELRMYVDAFETISKFSNH